MTDDIINIIMTDDNKNKRLNKTEKDMITNGKSHIKIELKTKKCGRKIFLVEPEKK